MLGFFTIKIPKDTITTRARGVLIMMKLKKCTQSIYVSRLFFRQTMQYFIFHLVSNQLKHNCLPS